MMKSFTRFLGFVLAAFLSQSLAATAATNLTTFSSQLGGVNTISADFNEVGTIPGVDVAPVVPSDLPPLRPVATGSDWLRFDAVTEPNTSNSLFRIEGGQEIFMRTLAAGARTSILDENLRVGERYCYLLETRHGPRHEMCLSTDWRVGFEAGEMSEAASARVLALFDWRDTKTLATDSADGPMLHYMNILVQSREAIDQLRQIGMHVEAEPLFPVEYNGWAPRRATSLDENGEWQRWLFAVVPGALYNKIRERSLARIDAGEETTALVFRDIPILDAVGSSRSLDYRYLGENGFEFEAEAVAECSASQDTGEIPCTSRFAIGWLVRKIGGAIGEGLEDFVDGVRRGLGRFKRVVSGDVTLTVHFELLNTDPLFGDEFSPRQLRSAWSGLPLHVEGVEVQVRQGLYMYTGEMNASGSFSRKVAKHSDTTVCINLKNRAATLSEGLTDETVCTTHLGSVESDTDVTVQISNDYVQTLAVLTDARRYMQEVMGVVMPSLFVQVGWIANTLSVGDRAFAPCMSDRPLLSTAAIETLGSLAPGIDAGIGIATGATAETLLSVDIVLPTADDGSRGVIAHEYGHAVMCELLKQKGEATFQTAWSDIILNLGNEQASNEAWVVNEAFADFLASQIVGGTNYFETEDFEASMGINYTTPGSEGLDFNYNEGIDLEGVEAYQAEIRRVASILHDVFDGHRNADFQPNDGSHWDLNGGRVLESVLGDDSDLNDDPFALDGGDIRQLIGYLRGGTLNFGTFLGGLRDLLADRGHSAAEVEALFTAHSAPAPVVPSTTSVPKTPVLEDPFLLSTPTLETTSETPILYEYPKTTLRR